MVPFPAFTVEHNLNNKKYFAEKKPALDRKVQKVVPFIATVECEDFPTEMNIPPVLSISKRLFMKGQLLTVGFGLRWLEKPSNSITRDASKQMFAGHPLCGCRSI